MLIVPYYPRVLTTVIYTPSIWFCTSSMRRGDEAYRKAADFWAKIFAPAFIIGAVTGIPLEFGFGTNWALFSTVAGGVIGQTVAMEGVFAFFVESAFLGIYLFGRQTFGPRLIWFSAFMIFVGSWSSAYFILTVNSWMQSPVAYERLPDGNLGLESYWGLLFNPWMLHQYPHVMGGAVVTGSFVMAGVGAFYLLSNRDLRYGRMFVTIGVTVGFIASAFQIFPAGDAEGKAVAREQPIKLAAQEGLFESEEGAPLVLIGQIDVENREIDNPLEIPKILSFVSYRSWSAEVKGLEEFPRSRWPDNIPFVYYSYRFMILLGSAFPAIMGLAVLLRFWGGRLFRSRRVLWLLMLSAPFPFVANSMGWITTETGRQPWLAYGLLRTADGASPTVNAGTVYFTLTGLLGLFLLLTLLYLLIAFKEIAAGPEAEESLQEDQLPGSQRGWRGE
jgi:cytochrome d ubiquinol oxidase subunit I